MKNNKIRVVSILALCISVLGISLGFAAFSNTLTISSGAVVTPDESDFNIDVFGISEGYRPSLEQYNSATISVPVLDGAKSASNAKITDDGKNIVISDLKPVFSEPGDTATYYFLIRNRGKYDAYLDAEKFEELNVFGPVGSCVPGEGTNPDLVEKTCPYIMSNLIISSSDGYGYYMEKTIPLPKNDYLLVEYVMYYYSHYQTDVPRADGEFTVNFEDMVFEFSTVPGEE